MTVCGDRVLVAVPIERDYVTASGLLVTDDQPKTVGTVVAVGDVADVRVDDVVIFSPFSGQPLDYDGTRYLVLREDDVLAIWE